MTEEKGRGSLSEMETEQLMVARVLFDALKDVLKSGSINDDEIYENIIRIEEEISEIDVELLTRDDIPDSKEQGEELF